MDLIYADADRKDIGVLDDYNFDLAFGKDENNFDLTVPIENNVCAADYIVYVEGTEYGGIIDKVTVDTGKRTITYSGRTWHGILAGKVVEPEGDYLVLSGDANAVIGQLISRAGLEGLFQAETNHSGLEIHGFQVRYSDAYSTMKKMLKAPTGKLKMVYREGTVKISAVPWIDYSQRDDWDSSQLTFNISQNNKPINHLVCLGVGNLKDRKVIHLFSGQNGGIMPYTTKEVPVQDSDYILDKSQQVMFGDDEVAEVYDYSSAQTTENYILLINKPDNWDKVFPNYYSQEEDKMKNLELVDRDVYTLQLSEPDDWNKGYKKYFKKSGETYIPVSDLGAIIYTVQIKKPYDWTNNFASYYVKSGSSYKNVSIYNYSEYRLVTFKPEDWKKNYEAYYRQDDSGNYKKVETIYKDAYVLLYEQPEDFETNYSNYYVRLNVLSSEKVRYEAVTEGRMLDIIRNDRKFGYECMIYEKITYRSVPDFNADDYYTFVTWQAAPEWIADTYYTEGIQNIPTWQNDTYYTKTVEKFPPTFISGAYYEKVLDHYAELVKSGIERLEKYADCNNVSISFEANQEYDIGDVVGATENTTGLSVWQPITKKIVKIISGTESIDYEIGE